MQNKIKTKIVCTIGPSSWSEEVMRSMINDGMTVARINGAFADLEELDRVKNLVRSISGDVAMMVDIKGHEVRLNKFKEPKKLEIGDEFILGDSEDYEIYPVSYPDLHMDLNEGDKLVFADGAVEAKITKISEGQIHCKVIYGEYLEPGKSINTPDSQLTNHPVTERDIKQIKHCSSNGWEFISASFIRKLEDIHAVKEHIEGDKTRIIAKIEDDEGVENIDEIIDNVYGIMIARGDMGVEMPFEKIPSIQKDIIRKCNLSASPVITATHMLESMVNSPRPTRAEITDVANAVLDGTDAVMTSAETTKGNFPSETVHTMMKIAKEAETNLVPTMLGFKNLNDLAYISTRAAFEVATSKNINAVIVISKTGRTARLLARYRLNQPIFTYVSDEKHKNSLQLTSGILNTFTIDFESSNRDDFLNKLIDDFSNKDHQIAGKVLLLGNYNGESSPFRNIFEIVTIN
jgi:pyruvate kinase